MKTVGQTVAGGSSDRRQLAGESLARRRDAQGPRAPTQVRTLNLPSACRRWRLALPKTAVLHLLHLTNAAPVIDRAGNDC